MLQLHRSPSLRHLKLSAPAGIPTTEEGDPWDLCRKVYRTSDRPVERGGFALVYIGNILQPNSPPVVSSPPLTVSSHTQAHRMHSGAK